METRSKQFPSLPVRLATFPPTKICGIHILDNHSLKHICAVGKW